MTYTITRDDLAADIFALQDALNVLKASASWDSPTAARLRALRNSIAEQVKPAIEEPEPVWWTTDPAAAHAAAKVGVVYGGTAEHLSWQIGEQLNPAIEEPKEFGSIVRAKMNRISQPRLWQSCPTYGKHYWMSQDGGLEVWSDLTDVEVLRVGLAESMDVAPECTEDYKAGVGDTVHKLHQRLQFMLSDAIGAERKNAIERMIQAVEELAQ